jgi:hypothetical protein
MVVQGLGPCNRLKILVSAVQSRPCPPFFSTGCSPVNLLRNAFVPSCVPRTGTLQRIPADGSGPDSRDPFNPDPTGARFPDPFLCSSSGDGLTCPDALWQDRPAMGGALSARSYGHPDSVASRTGVMCYLRACAPPLAKAESPREPDQSRAVSTRRSALEPAARRRGGLSQAVRASRMLTAGAVCGELTFVFPIRIKEGSA